MLFGGPEGEQGSHRNTTLGRKKEGRHVPLLRDHLNTLGVVLTKGGGLDLACWDLDPDQAWGLG